RPVTVTSWPRLASRTGVQPAARVSARSRCASSSASLATNRRSKPRSPGLFAPVWPSRLPGVIPTGLALPRRLSSSPAVAAAVGPAQARELRGRLRWQAQRESFADRPRFYAAVDDQPAQDLTQRPCSIRVDRRSSNVYPVHKPARAINTYMPDIDDATTLAQLGPKLGAVVARDLLRLAALGRERGA